MLMGEDLVDQGLSAKMVAIILGVVRDHKVSLSVSPHTPLVVVLHPLHGTSKYRVLPHLLRLHRCCLMCH